jgi:hypothetical protein
MQFWHFEIFFEKNFWDFENFWDLEKFSHLRVLHPTQHRLTLDSHSSSLSALLPSALCYAHLMRLTNKK